MPDHPIHLPLSGKHILITGAAQGVGRQLAENVVAQGGRVAALDLDATALATLRDAMPPGQVLPLAGSVTDPGFVSQAVERAVSHFGALHGLVNNAGITRPAMIEKMSTADWQAVIDVHLGGAFHLLQAVGRHMLARFREGDTSGGSIVNISSDAGRRGTIGQINYGTAKAGVLGLTMCAAREWAPYHVRVNTVGFGVIDTAMTQTIRSERFRETYLAQIPLRRWGRTAEVAQPICFLLSDAASYVTGQHLSVNGGYTIGL